MSMSLQKPVVWVSALMTRFEEQLPCRIGPQTHLTRINVQQNKVALIHISKCKFSLVISGLTKTLTKINDLQQLPEFQRDYYESLLIVLDTLEKCLSQQTKEAAPKYDDLMNVKLLLKEICQFLDMHNETSTQVVQIRTLASKVLLALSVNNFQVKITCGLVWLFYIASEIRKTVILLELFFKTYVKLTFRPCSTAFPDDFRSSLSRVKSLPITQT